MMVTTLVKPVWVISNVLHVELIGPAWWISYLIVPFISVLIALLAAWVAHRLTMREQQRQFKEERLNNERRTQVDQNVKLERLITMLNSANAALDTATFTTDIPSIPVTSLVDLATRCQLGDVFADFIRYGVSYESVRQKWQAGDTSNPAELHAASQNLRDELVYIKAVTQSTLENGWTRLNQLDLPTRGR